MFKSKVKNSQRCYFAWENLRWGFCVVVIFSLVDVVHFVVVLLIAFRHHPSSSCGLSPGFLHPILYFQPSPSQSDSQQFVQPFPSCRECYGLEWAFFTHRHFLRYAPSRHFWQKLLLSRLPWEPEVISWNLQDFILILEAETGSICLFDSR